MSFIKTLNDVRAGICLPLILILAVTFPSMGWAQPTPAGSEFQVSTYTTSTQRNSAVAADSDGDFVVVWDSLSGQDGDANGTFGQRYNSAGTAQGSEFQVNTYTTESQFGPAVAADSDGDFVVVWTSVDAQDGSSGGIFGQRYNSAGTLQGSEFQVNTYTTSGQTLPAVAADSAGDFVVVWQSYAQDGSNYAVSGQRYNSAGTLQGSEFQVNTYTTAAQRDSAVAADSDGDFVVVWNSFGQDGSLTGIFGQRYNSAGTLQGSEFQVNTYTTGNQLSPVVAADSDGDFVVVWTSAGGQDGDGYGIFGQRYDSAGTLQGSEFQVNTYTTSSQTLPAVATDSAGVVKVVWRSEGQDGSSGGVFGQAYDSAGAKQGSEFQVNTYTTAFQSFPAIAAGGDGVISVVVWTSKDQDGSDTGIFAQRYTCGVGVELLVLLPPLMWLRRRRFPPARKGGV